MKEKEKPSNPKEELIKEIWYDLYGYPLQWSLDLSKMDNKLGKVHKNRLKYFTLYLETEHNRDFTEMK